MRCRCWRCCGSVSSGSLSLAVLAVLGFIGAAGTVGFSVAAPALVPQLVPQQSLAARQCTARVGAQRRVCGRPGVGRRAGGMGRRQPAFVCATALSMLATLLLLRIPASPRATGPQRHVLDELRHGAGLVWRDPLLRPVMWTAVVWNLAWFVLQAAYVPYAMRRLGLTADTVGFTLGCYGAGMLIGATLATRVTRALPFGMAVLLGPLMSVLAAAAMLATLWWPHGVAGGVGVRAVRRRPAGVGGDHHHAAPDAGARRHAGPGVGDLPHGERRRAAARRRTRRRGRQRGARRPASRWPLRGFVLQALVISGSPVRVLRSLPRAGGTVDAALSRAAA